VGTAAILDREQRRLANALATCLDSNFEQVVAAYQDRLFAFVLTLVRNASEAEEIAQDAFVAAYRALRSYEPERIRELKVRAWLFTIALNRVRNRSRKIVPLSIDDAEQRGIGPQAEASDGPEAVALLGERAEAVRRALQTLSPRYRTPVILRHVEGMSYSEIAAVLDQPVGTAKANVHRGLALLRDSAELGGVA